MHIIGFKNRSPLLFFTAFFLLITLFTVALASQVISQPTYTEENIFVELLEVRREQPLSDRIGSSIRFNLVNPLPTEEEYEFQWEELLEGIAQPSDGYDILVKNTTLKEVVVQNKTFVETTTIRTETFPNGTITWDEIESVQADGNPATYTKLVDSGWINITQIKDGKAKLNLKPGEKIEVMYITYFKRQLGLNKRDVVPAVKVLDQVYKKSDWAVTFEDYNKVFSIKTDTDVTNATIWVELQDVAGLNPSTDYRDNCQDIRLTNNNNDTILRFGIGTMEISGCQTSDNRTQINFRAPFDIDTNGVMVWFNDSTVTNFGNISYLVMNYTRNNTEMTGWIEDCSGACSPPVTWTVGPEHILAPPDNQVNAIFEKDLGSSLINLSDKRLGITARILETGGPNTGGSCFIKFGFGSNDGGPAVGFIGNTNEFGYIHSDTTGQVGYGGDATDDTQTVVKFMYDGTGATPNAYVKHFHASGNEGGIGWNHTTTSSAIGTGSKVRFQHNNWQCQWDDIEIWNATEEPAFYNTTFTVTLSPVYTNGSSGGEPPASYIDETDGRDAIVDGIRNVLGNDVPLYTDQQIYVRLTNTSQYLGRFDKATRLNNRIWAFNYVTDSQTPANVPGVGNSLNVLEMINRSTKANVTSDVENFITNSRIS